MIDSVPSIAPRSPPLTGASRQRSPRAAPAAATRRATSGRIELMSMYSVPDRALSTTPSGPSATASTSGESGSIVMTASALRTAAATLPAHRPPAASRLVADSGRREWPATSKPALTRLAAIGRPMMPRPMNATVRMFFAGWPPIAQARRGEDAAMPPSPRRRSPAAVVSSGAYSRPTHPLVSQPAQLPHPPVQVGRARPWLVPARHVSDLDVADPRVHPVQHGGDVLAVHPQVVQVSEQQGGAGAVGWAAGPARRARHRPSAAGTAAAR